jgi:shikimate dehydrogenase
VVDLVYTGSEDTALITAARERGSTTVDGLEVLVHQGALSLEIWTGRTAPLAAMRDAARAAVPPRTLTHERHAQSFAPSRLPSRTWGTA